MKLLRIFSSVIRPAALRLGFLPCLALSFAVPGHAAIDSPAEATSIESETLEMRGTESHNYFYFEENVRVMGDNLEILCDRLEVVSTRRGDPDATIGEIGAIEQIIAIGNVRILQGGREALAGRAVMDPVEGTVVLSDNPRILDRDTEVTGWRIVLSRDKSIRVLRDPATTGERRRTTVTLGGELPDFSFDRDEPPPTSAEDDWIGGDPLDELLREDADKNRNKEGQTQP